MIKGLIMYHLILLVKDPALVLLGLAFPFVQLFLHSQDNLVAADASYINIIDTGIVSFMCIAAMVLCWGASYNHAYSREIKFLRRLRMSPVKPLHYIVSGIVLNIGVLVVFASALIIVAAVLFDIDITSKNWALIIALLLLIFTMFYVMGMFVANMLKKAKNSQSLSYVVFGGMIVVVNMLAIDSLPNFIQVIIRNTPITYATNVLLAAWLGTGLFNGHDFIGMMACVVVLGLLSVKFFKYE